MKRVISAAVVLSALLTVSAQAQSTYVPNSGYPTNGTQNVTYTDQSNAANPYQNQTVTGTDPYAANQNPYAANQNPYATNQNPYAANQNPYASGDSSAVPYSSAAPYSAQGTDLGSSGSAVLLPGVTPSPIPASGLSDYGSVSPVSSQMPGVTPSPLPMSGLSDFGGVSPVSSQMPGVTPSPIPVSGLSDYGSVSPVPSQMPGVTPSPLPLSSLAATSGATAAPIVGSADEELSELTDAQSEEDAGDPLYDSTRQYIEKLRSSGFSCTYRGKQGTNSESVFASFSGNNVTLNTIAVFSDTETDCILYVLHFVNFEGKNPDRVSPLLDALNADYRFAKFYSAPDGTVSVTLDLLFSGDNAGEICYDGLRRLLSICDECHEALASSIEALPDAGEGISEWDDSGLEENDSDVQQSVSDASVPYADPTVPVSTPFPSGNTNAQTSQNGQRNVIMKVKIRNGGSLNVRVKPDQNSILVGTAEGGRTYDCLSVADNGWYEIVLPNGMTGFISGKRVTEIKQGEE